MASAHQHFSQHFANIEDAKTVMPQQLTLQALERSSKALDTAIHSEMPLSQLPSIFELEDAIRTLNNNKAFVGCIPAELLRANPAQAAEMLYPTLIHFFRFYQQPASWKGGQYYPLYKGKGSVSKPGSFRAILLGNVVPKVFSQDCESEIGEAGSAQVAALSDWGIASYECALCSTLSPAVEASGQFAEEVKCSFVL